MFRNKTLVVIGGGDTALEEATHLTHFASKVVLLVRRDVLRASEVMQNKVKNNEKIEIMRNTEALEAVGDGKFLTSLKIKNNKNNQEQILECA